MKEWSRLCLLGLLFFAFGSSIASAQAIAGVVKDASGAVMPGVTVEASSPVLIEKIRTVVSDGDGQYKIISLRPGTYTVTFTLPGFRTIKREGVEITNDFTAPINAEMRVGGLEETITVSGQSPLVDTQSITQKKSLTAEMIDALPTGRSFQNLSVLVPGVTVALGSQDVGGSGGERYQTLAVHGSRADQMPLVMNGMPYNNMNNTGGGYNTTMVINTGTVQEMTVTTSGLSAEARSSGVLSNTLPKEGGNSFRGYFLGNFANSSFQSDNLSDELQTRGLLRVNRIKKLWDVNPTFGGPLVQDKLWFYGGFRSSGAQNYIAGMFKNLRPGAPQDRNKAAGCSYGDQFHPTTLVPNSQDLDNQAVGGDTWTRGETMNLTWQATQKNKFTMFGHFNQRLVDCNQCSGTTSPEAGVYFTHRPEYILQGTWNNPLTNRVLLEGGFTFYNERWIFGPKPENVNGYGSDAVISKTESTLGVLYGSAGNAAPFVKAGNHQYNMRAAVNYVTGSHAFKFGMADMWGTRAYQYDINQSQAWTFTNGIPASIGQYARPLYDREHLDAALGLYGQDRWTINRVTLNVGLRFDYHKASVPAQNLPAITFVAARQINELNNVPNWKDLSPRVGATYDLFGNGKTVLRGNYGKYLASESTNMATLNNPVNTSVNSATRSWSDTNGNFFPDCDLKNSAAQNLTASGGDNCGALNAPLGSLQIAAAYDPSITSGFGVRPSDQEIAIGAQHELLPWMALDVQATRHWFGNFVAAENTAQPPSSFNSFCVTPPSATQNGFSLPNGGAQICGYANLKPEFTSVVPFAKITRSSDYGKATDVYTGFDVNLNARLARGGMISGGISTGHEVLDICDVAARANVAYASVAGVLASSSGTVVPFGSVTAAGATASPSTLYCRVEPPFQPDVKGLVSYPLPWFGLRASGTIQNRPGPQILANYTITATNLGQTTLPALSGGSATAPLIAPGTLYNDRFTQIDVRFGKSFKARTARINASFDVYNLMNSSAILAQNNTFGPAWQTPTQILQGRLFKLGAQIDF